jgi:hypothetical protein
VLKGLIEARLRKRLQKAGLSHSIPVFDPMEDQADALIRKLYELDKGERPDYSQLPRFSVHTSGSDITVKTAAIRHKLGEAVVQTVDFDGAASRKREHAREGQAGAKLARRPRAGRRSTPEAAAS